MKVIIAGGRDFDDYDFLEKKCNYLLSGVSNIEIVSGKQVSIDKEDKHKFGADYWGEVYAERKGYPVKEFPADWNKYGNSAGPLRNKEMAKYADALIAFYDGKSRGTGNMIEEARKEQLKIRIVHYKKLKQNVTIRKR